MKTTTKRAQQAINSKQHIHKITMQLFQEKGYDNVTVSEICKTAGVSVGSFYHYFNSKEDALMLMYSQFGEWLDGLDLTGNVLNTFFHISLLQTSAAAEFGCTVFLKMMETNLNNPGKYMSYYDNKLTDVVVSLVTKGFEEGLFDPAFSPAEVAETYMRVSRGVLFDWVLRRGSYDLREVILHDVKIALRSFVKRDLKDNF